MRVGFNLLVVGGFITPEHAPLFEDLKRHGYDGVELPMFEGSVEHYAALGRRLTGIGLGATTCAIMTEAQNPISPEAPVREAARERLRWAIDCTASAALWMRLASAAAGSRIRRD